MKNETGKDPQDFPVWLGGYFTNILLVFTNGKIQVGGKNQCHVSCRHYKVKVKLSLCLTKHYAMKAYWGVEVQLHPFFDLGTRRR
jgi:hypothetical protein